MKKSKSSSATNVKNRGQIKKIGYLIKVIRLGGYKENVWKLHDAPPSTENATITFRLVEWQIPYT